MCAGLGQDLATMVAHLPETSKHVINKWWAIDVLANSPTIKSL